MNAREEVLARIAAAHRAAPPPDLRYEDIAREYRTTSDSSAEALTELLIDRLVDYRALVRQCSADDLGATIAACPRRARRRYGGCRCGLGPVLDGKPLRERPYRWAIRR